VSLYIYRVRAKTLFESENIPVEWYRKIAMGKTQNDSLYIPTNAKWKHLSSLELAICE
jgi:hypothetical protein